jgi:hypothetical protein
VQIQAAETGSISRPNDPAVALENMFSHFKQERRTHERHAEQRDHQECGQDARDPGASLSQEKADRVEPPNLNADRVEWLQLIEPILNRVQPLLSDARAARMLNSRDCSIDFEEIIAEKKILLVTVPEGQLEKAGNLLGSLIIGGVRQASLNQYERTREAARPCSLYMDRLNNFMGADAFESICTDFRKISISIHATLKSLQDISEDYRNRVLVNFGAMAMFSLSKKDADLLGPGMFKVDGRKVRKWNIRDMFGIVNSSPTMDLASDEEKINVNRLVGLPERCYFLHLVGEVVECSIFELRNSRILQEVMLTGT